MSLSSSTRTPSQGTRGAGRSAGGGATRLPSSRERRPALAALAVILILLGAAGSALIALNSGNRSDFVAIAPDKLAPGHRIEPKDLSRGDLAGATGGLIPWSEANKYLGRYTTTWLYKDQFVTPDNFTKDGAKPIPADGALVGVSLEAGRAPSDGLDVGDMVSVIRVPAATGDSGIADHAGQGRRGHLDRGCRHGPEDERQHDPERDSADPDRPGDCRWPLPPRPRPWCW